jgi:tellurite resistance protein TehA-like permease
VPAATPSPLAARIAALPPISFALVMATGIVASALLWLDIRPLAWALFWLNLALYTILAALTLWRFLAFPDRVWLDLKSHVQAPGFFTLVAGSCVLGSQFTELALRPEIASALWAVGIVLWVGVLYALFTVLATRAVKPKFEEAFSGSWLLIVIATQSLSILGTQLAALRSTPGEAVLGFTLTLFLLGWALYIALLALLLFRFLFTPLTPRELTAPYWTAMGAVAITTYAGSLLALHAPLWPLLEELRPFLLGITLLAWAVSTWWIPLLLALGYWRHVARRYPLRYNANDWAIVFPLGMYTVATFHLIRSLDWPGLIPLATIVGYMALAAWTVLFVGMVKRVLRVA